jgi:DNA end-binding protein Ku
MRPIWSGSISFGLVTVPVQMFSATQSQELRFHFLHKDDLQPIGYDKVRKDTGEHVAPDDVVRGFEIEKGKYVPIEDEDLDRLDIELTHSIDILDFVDLEEIDPIYYRKAYYLTPQDDAEKPYRLLVRALDDTGKVGIAKVVIRNKQHLAALRAHDGVLVLETMYYSGRGAEAGVRERQDEVAEGRGRHGEIARREPQRQLQAGEVRRHVPKGAARPHQGEGEG